MALYSTTGNLGYMGSVFCDTADAPITPPTGKVFIAITFLNNTTLEILSQQATGLVGDTSQDGIEHIGTTVAAHNLTAGNETAVSGAGGAIVDSSNSFQAHHLFFWI